MKERERVGANELRTKEKEVNELEENKSGLKREVVHKRQGNKVNVSEKETEFDETMREQVRKGR